MIRTAHTTCNFLGNLMLNQVLKIKVLCQARIHLTNSGKDHTVLSVKAKMSMKNVKKKLA